MGRSQNPKFFQLTHPNPNIPNHTHTFSAEELLEEARSWSILSSTRGPEHEDGAPEHSPEPFAWTSGTGIVFPNSFIAGSLASDISLSLFSLFFFFLKHFLERETKTKRDLTRCGVRERERQRVLWRRGIVDCTLFFVLCVCVFLILLCFDRWERERERERENRWWGAQTGRWRCHVSNIERESVRERESEEIESEFWATSLVCGL